MRWLSYVLAVRVITMSSMCWLDNILGFNSKSDFDAFLRGIDPTSTPRVHTVVIWQSFQNQNPTLIMVLLFVFIYYDDTLNTTRKQGCSSFWSFHFTHTLPSLTCLPVRPSTFSFIQSLPHSLTPPTLSPVWFHRWLWSVDHCTFSLPPFCSGRVHCCWSAVGVCPCREVHKVFLAFGNMLGGLCDNGVVVVPTSLALSIIAGAAIQLFQPGCLIVFINLIQFENYFKC